MSQMEKFLNSNTSGIETRLDGIPEYLMAHYLCILDNELKIYPTADTYRYVLYWRRTLSPARIRLTTDEYWQYTEDHQSLSSLCRQARIWENAKLRGIIDLREKPIRFEITGRKFLPYYTEYDILLKIVE